MTRDYYEVLGVDKKASAEEIKKAYRKLAREHHPDMVADHDKDGAEERFKEINEAYQVLSDPQKKQMYDQYGHAGFGAQQNGFGGNQGAQGQWGPFTYTYTSGGNNAYGNIDPFDVFEEFFGFRGFGGNRKPKRGKNLYYEFHVTFGEAVHGVEKTVEVESGKVKIKIPQGVRDGSELRFAGKGMPGPDGLPSGDLLLTIRVPTPSEFRRVGDNLATLVEIDFVQAILGDKVEIPVVDLDSKTGIGKVKVKVPSGTQPGATIRLKGKGMPKLHGYGRGDVLVQLSVVLPKKISRKQKKILEDYTKA
ncbi:MAG: DnaJ C-terminal domain-containing protein [Patescibacteria group bacterium]